MSFMLDTKLGRAIFFLLRNDLVWNLMSSEDREFVQKNNLVFNTKRDDYADPIKYDFGNNFDSTEGRENNKICNILLEYLNDVNPEVVIEFGPGSGYYTRSIVEFPSVKKYIGIDVNEAFLSFVSGKLKTFNKSDFTYEVLVGDGSLMQLPNADSMIFLNTVHHIPNRKDLFANVVKSFRNQGSIFVCDPSHYIPRIVQLFKRFFSRGYLSDRHAQNLATHHFCSTGEYLEVCNTIDGLDIDHQWYWGLNRVYRRIWGDQILGNDCGSMAELITDRLAVQFSFIDPTS